MPRALALPADARSLCTGTPRAPIKRALKEAQEALAAEERKDPVLRNPARIVELKAEIERLEKRIDAIPFIDTYDLRYHQLPLSRNHRAKR